MTSARIVVPGATLAITRRTTLRKAFLSPWHPGVAQASLYALAAAQKDTGVAVHHVIDVITHHHLSATPSRDNLSELLGRYHHDKSCALNTLLARERYDQPGELFDDRSTHVMRLCDAASQSTQLTYEHLNCVAAGLVDRPEHMPGYAFRFDLWKAGGIEVRRPDFYFSANRPEVLWLELTPPPLLYRAFGGDLDALVYHMERVANDGVRALRPHHKRAALGARRVARLHPWSEPTSLRETRGKRLPTFRIGARGILGRQMHIAAANEVTRFRRGHSASNDEWVAGNREVVYPYGTYLMRVRHGARVAEPPAPDTSIVCAPGPLLCDVEAELEAARERCRAAGVPLEPDDRRGLLEQTRQALHEEAAELCEHASEAMDFSGKPAPVAAAPPDGEGDAQADAPVVVRHRFARPRGEHRQDARRIVTLRDRRRGRPPAVRHGSDPPA